MKKPKTTTKKRVVSKAKTVKAWIILKGRKTGQLPVYRSRGGAAWHIEYALRQRGYPDAYEVPCTITFTIPK